MLGRTYFSNYCSSEERAQTQTKMGFKLKFYLLNLTAVTGTNYKTSSRTFGVGIIFVLPISEGDRERKSNDGCHAGNTGDVGQSLGQEGPL